MLDLGLKRARRRMENVGAESCHFAVHDKIAVYDGTNMGERLDMLSHMLSQSQSPLPVLI